MVNLSFPFTGSNKIVPGKNIYTKRLLLIPKNNSVVHNQKTNSLYTKKYHRHKPVASILKRTSQKCEKIITVIIVP